MDIIDKFIKKNKHITKNSIIINKTWNDFNIACENRKLILYGIIAATNLLWIRNQKDISIIAAIDNGKEKNHHILSEFFDEANLKNSKDIKIESKEALKQYNPDEIVVLISSLSNYEKIAEELEEENFYCYFSLINLEFYYREYANQHGLNFETLDSYERKYVEECLSRYSVQDNKIVFIMGDYIDHGKYITKQLLTLNKNLNITWIVTKSVLDIPKNVKIVNIININQYIYEIETAKVWVVSTIVPEYIFKRENQTYIHIKHWGSITLKKFSLEDINSFKNFMNQSIFENTEKRINLNGKWLDYLISGSEFDENAFRRGYNFHGKCLRFGSSRSDVMFHQEECRDKIYNYFKLESDEHIALYAPTFRYNDTENGDLKYVFKNFLNFNMLFESLKKRWLGNWKILFRIHPSISRFSSNIEYPNFVINASYYEDSQELLAAADILISDYSSIMFELAYVLKPVFLYAPDKNTFEKSSRELLINYYSLPFPISETNEELSEKILNFNEIQYKQNVKAFLDKYGVHEDGHASERAANFILSLLSEEGESRA